MEVADILREGIGVVLIGGGWMLETLLEFSRYLFTLM